MNEGSRSLFRLWEGGHILVGMSVTEDLWGLGRWEAAGDQVGRVAYSAVHHCTAGSSPVESIVSLTKGVLGQQMF